MANQDEMTLGDFIKHLSALLQQKRVKMPFKNEKPWHLALYEMKSKRDLPGRPMFLDTLVFDWDGRYPKSRSLSEFLHALHWNSSVSAGNPSYESISLDSEIEGLWSKPVENLPPEARQFFDTAVTIAQNEFEHG